MCASVVPQAEYDARMSPIVCRQWGYMVSRLSLLVYNTSLVVERKENNDTSCVPLCPPRVSVHSSLFSFYQKQTLAEAHLEYNLRLYDEARRSIARALELGYVDDGTMQIQLARIHVRRHNVDTSNSRRDLTAALASFSEALKFKTIALTAVHYLEVRASRGRGCGSGSWLHA